MAAADMYVGWVDDSGIAQAFDLYSFDYSQPALDTEIGGQDNVDHISGTQVRRVQCIVLSLPLPRRRPSPSAWAL